MQELDINFVPYSAATALRLRPGDIVVFTCPQHLSDEQRARASRQLDEVFVGHEVLILDGGQKLEVVRPLRWWQFWR